MMRCRHSDLLALLNVVERPPRGRSSDTALVAAQRSIGMHVTSARRRERRRAI
jgi:hypothetical protein